MLSLLSSPVSRENFPKQSAMLARILGVRIWEYATLLKIDMLIMDKVCTACLGICYYCQHGVKFQTIFLAGSTVKKYIVIFRNLVRMVERVATGPGARYAEIVAQ